MIKLLKCLAFGGMFALLTIVLGVGLYLLIYVMRGFEVDAVVVRYILNRASRAAVVVGIAMAFVQAIHYPKGNSETDGGGAGRQSRGGGEQVKGSEHDESDK
ncbi:MULTISPECIES: hypothetical protein [Luteibacter]|uniref:hypothetical protein n=1 Tax=Luteibacter TaxID=242605 RepID=UPI0005671EBD|nr:MULTISPECIES: hypothetical protein [unclassified Luteibacter]SKB99017.1 hypothetical protein SAMN05660880_03612 [Luteibacter sp. 22Crub2.1]